ncbi:MAG: excinuclease ABC subunit UvrC [Epulopiscium sp.]|nr:excinuclease ABC subunit UvrC [Candidatus Epulonipiscium sp.]
MFDIQEELKKLPSKPGVYLMKDENDQVIYVGKAIHLKNRVRQYFQSAKNQTPKVQTMVPHIKEFEYIVTDSEMEALILECNLIKKYRPHYNIMLKDDKMYPYVKVTTNEAFPRVFITRRMEKDKAKYYGPFTDVLAVKETVETLHTLYPIRKCKKNLPKEIGKERPCLNYHMGQCSAPCAEKISQEDYRKLIDNAIRFLDGKHDEIQKQLEALMQEASDNMEYEKAAILRDKIKSIQRISERQKMDNTGLGDCDVIAFVRAFEEGLAQVFFIRNGKMTGREHFTLKASEHMSRSEIMTEIVKQFYSGTAFIPKEILLQEEPLAEEKVLLQEYLSIKRGNKVTLTVPQKGEKHNLVELAWKNAMITFEQFGEKIKREEQRTVGAVEELQKALGLSQKITRIESYDISNTQGFESVGSMVVFEDGRPKRSDYRKFKIKTVVGANDYASMEEVLTRRFRHGLQERENITEKEQKFSRFPDLILMDGGSIQVKAAELVLQRFGLSIPVCGMVKDDKHRTRGLIYQDREVYIPLTSEGFRLVTRIQDEVHRFAIEYHRKLRENKMLHSILDEIPGIGEVRRKALMKYFGSIDKIKSAEVEELLEVSEMNIKAAESVYAFFHPDPPREE